MSTFLTKRFPVYRLILVTLCLCLSFSSVAGALVMVPHNMTPVDTTDHATQLDQPHTNNHIEHHNSNQPAQAHNCCDDGQEVCSTSSACAAHCAASFAQRAPHLCPAIATSDFESDIVFAGPLALNLDGPFKPPR